MRILCIFAVLCTFGCAHNDRSSVTLENLVYVDPASATTQHPLVCGTGRDFPVGRELAFMNPEDKGLVHAVFPESVTPPDTVDGKFMLNGRYQTIQNRKAYTLKQPPADYRYFVVSSWKYQK